MPAELAVGLALLRYTAIRRRFAPETRVPRFPALSRELGGRDVTSPPPVTSRHHLSSSAVDTRARSILDRVRSVPPGFVRTYGDVSPGAPRLAGAVLHSCDDPAVPWHRIVRSDGSLAKGARQRALLDAEGVPFRRGRVDMRRARIPEF